VTKQNPKSSNSTPDFYISAEQDCNYLEEQSQSIFLDPNVAPTIELYQELLDQGFRRSGNNTYRPHCANCNECRSVRVKVNSFKPKTSQKRCLKKNNLISRKILPASFNSEHFQLYERYLKSRHKDAGMDNPTQEEYISFLGSKWSQTKFIEFRLKEDEDANHQESKLVAIAVTDVLPNALSSVYTFFEPDLAYQKRSLGVYAILSQIEEAKRLGLDWLYLGYWIKDNQKMAYKNQYKAAEYLIDGLWRVLP